MEDRLLSSVPGGCPLVPMVGEGVVCGHPFSDLPLQPFAMPELGLVVKWQVVLKIKNKIVMIVRYRSDFFHITGLYIYLFSFQKVLQVYKSGNYSVT